jgi:hypothetical protein
MFCAEWGDTCGGRIRIVKEGVAACGILQKQRISNKNVCYKSYIDGFTTVLLHTEGDEKIKRLFYGIVHSVMLG